MPLILLITPEGNSIIDTDKLPEPIKITVLPEPKEDKEPCPCPICMIERKLTISRELAKRAKNN